MKRILLFVISCMILCGICISCKDDKQFSKSGTSGSSISGTDNTDITGTWKSVKIVRGGEELMENVDGLPVADFFMFQFKEDGTGGSKYADGPYVEFVWKKENYSISLTDTRQDRNSPVVYIKIDGEQLILENNDQVIYMEKSE